MRIVGIALLFIGLYWFGVGHPVYLFRGDTVWGPGNGPGRCWKRHRAALGHDLDPSISPQEVSSDFRSVQGSRLRFVEYVKEHGYAKGAKRVDER